MDVYTRRLAEEMSRYAQKEKETLQTLYVGGGTPNLLGGERLALLIEKAAQAFFLVPGAEVTVEVNPTECSEDFFLRLRKAGVNRVSMGLQSANPDELRLLGRRHSLKDVENAVAAARRAGFQNLSLDLMLGLPKEKAFGEGLLKNSREKLLNSVRFVESLGVEHVSSYILKVEENTPFARQKIILPSDDDVAEEYLFLVQELERRGYEQYEISNFSRPGFESRHNLLYWHGEEYLGLGPGAHSFYKGNRFFYPRNLQDFIQGTPPTADGEGGGFQEMALLAFRLKEGLHLETCRERFGAEGERLFKEMLQRVKKIPPALIRTEEGRIFFTPQGFLVSNALIIRLLPEEL